ncbi:MAG: hypothetical protein HQL39_12090 [Alphaproteobacteria bacterium]|nr:hypothetical protein [Alphaproteobacteria bacterium]
MARSRESFEIQLFKDDHWVVHELKDSEKPARDMAAKLVANKKVRGVRVVRNWERSDGSVTESVIFEKLKEAEEEDARIVAIDEAPVCQQPNDYYALSSRMTVNRLLRRYFDQAILTPTELMHNYRQIKKVQELDSLYPSAIDRVATLQTSDGAGDSRQRRDELFRTFDQMASRAREAERRRLPELGADFGEVVAKLERCGSPDDQDYLSLVVLSADLVNNRSWLAKLERVAGLMNDALPSHPLGLLDGAAADLIATPAITEDMLGLQPNLATTLIRLIDLAEGSYSNDNVDPDAAMPKINRLIGEGRLGCCREALVDRIRRALRSAQPLNKNEPSHEKECFKQVAQRLCTPTGLFGGPSTAEALTLRFGRSLEEGGRGGRNKAIQGCIAALPEARFRFVYLLDLAGSEMGAEFLDDIVGHLNYLVGHRDINRISPRGRPPRERMLHLTAMHRAALESKLPEAEKARIADLIDEALCQFLLREGIIEKLDDKSSPLRVRANHLVNFCAAGVLPERGRSSKLARERVLTHLRAPNFDAIYTEGIATDEGRQKALRAFHQMLIKGGFAG